MVKPDWVGVAIVACICATAVGCLALGASDLASMFGSIALGVLLPSPLKVKE